MNTIIGHLFMQFGGLVRFIYGTLIRKLRISNAPFYSLKEYIHGSERPEDDHWDKGASHQLVNKVVGMISAVLIIFVILTIGGCNNPAPHSNSEKGIIEIATIQSNSSSLINNQDSLISIIRKLTNSPFPTYKIEITKKSSLNSHVFYIQYILSDGTSQVNYLMTFSENNFVDQEVLDKIADQDISLSHYEFRELKQSNADNFLVTDFSQTVADKNVLEPGSDYFKKEYNFENVKIKTDTTTIALTVTSNGIIRRDTIK